MVVKISQDRNRAAFLKFFFHRTETGVLDKIQDTARLSFHTINHKPALPPRNVGAFRIQNLLNGVRINILNDVLPAAFPAVADQIPECVVNPDDIARISHNGNGQRKFLQRTVPVSRKDSSGTLGGNGDISVKM